MGSIKFFISLYTVLIALSCAEDKQLTDTLEGAKAKKGRIPRISSEFGYNILNSDRVSSQFRQEHRDLSGVVRGSYGFKNPNGAFRFVHYVADDKGFRAHISSNENGVGQQNPASVSFDHFPSNPEDKSKLLISTLKKNDMLKPEAHLSRYDFYSPLDGNKFNGYQNSEQSSLDKKDAYRYDIRGHELLTTFKQNPVDKLIKTRIGVPGEFLNTFSQNKKLYSLWDSSSYPTSVDQPFPQDYSIKTFPNTLHETLLSPKTDIPGIALRTRGNNLKNLPSNYPQFLASLLYTPKQKVHTSLPDCDSVSSAILCKPPSILRRNPQYNTFLNDNKYFSEDSLQTSSTQNFFPDEKSFIDSESTDFGEIMDHTKRVTLPHLVPNSYPLRSDVYKNFMTYLHEHNKHDEQDKNCRKHGLASETSKDYTSPLESHKFTDEALATSLLPYDGELISQNLEQNNSPRYSINNRDEEFYSSLIRIIQNDESLNKLKNLILQPSSSPKDSIAGPESPKLSLLGVLILPSNIINELSYKGSKKTLVTNVPDTSNRNSLLDKIPEPDNPDDKRENTDSNNHSEVSYDADSDVNVTSSEESDVGSETTKHDSDFPTYIPLVMSKAPPLLQTANNTSHLVELPVETVTSSKLYVYDDQNLSSDNEESANHSSNSSSYDWRKVLEEEISKEIRGMSLDEDTQSSDSISDKITNPKRPEQQFILNKHIGPLYDSTGKLIEPENVPIHIHRFNPPSSISSLPWKYSIPRPAPPRSIVVPPRPPTLS